MNKILRCYFSEKGLICNNDFKFFLKHFMEKHPFIKSIGMFSECEEDFIDIFFHKLKIVKFRNGYCLNENDYDEKCYLKNMTDNILTDIYDFLKENNLSTKVKIVYDYWVELCSLIPKNTRTN